MHAALVLLYGPLALGTLLGVGQDPIQILALCAVLQDPCVHCVAVHLQTQPCLQFAAMAWHAPHIAVMWPVPLLSGHMGASGQDWQTGDVSEDSGRTQQAAKPGKQTVPPEVMRPYFSPPRDVPKQIRLANGIRLIGCLPACEPPQCTGSRRRLRTCS